MTRRYQTASTRDQLGLTPTERACADLLVCGLGATRIAARLGKSPTAVQSALGRLYRKLGVTCAAYAVDALIGRSPCE